MGGDICGGWVAWQCVLLGAVHSTAVEGIFLATTSFRACFKRKCCRMVCPTQQCHPPALPAGEVKRNIAIVGKGLTFDSGGYNLKAGAGSMIEMMKVRGCMGVGAGGCCWLATCRITAGCLAARGVGSMGGLLGKGMRCGGQHEGAS